ncbi:MAG: glycosyltransferase [Proteobacteria bacterium]|nr:glycosyltransferase [Pseudomonadota bacterium]
MSRRYQVIYAPGHPAMQYHIAQTGHDFHILANWEQFAGWRPRPANVTSLFDAYDDSHLRLDVPDFRAMLEPGNRFGFPERYDFAWSMWNEQFTIFRNWDIPRVHRVAKFAELTADDYDYAFSRDDFTMASYYQYTADQIEEAYGVRIPLIELGLNRDTYSGWTGEDAEILTVVHSWKDRGWHHHLWAEACADLPTRHVDHLNPGPEGTLDFDQIRAEMRRCRVYWHDGENEYTVALLEAMMTGAPIITADMPFVERHVQHGVNGFISSDPTQLREYARMLLDDVDLAQKMGAESRRMALERYDEERWIRQWNELFDGFMADR